MHYSYYLVYDTTRALHNSLACCETVDSSSSLFMHAKEPKAHQVATLYLKHDMSKEKIRFSKIKLKQKRKMQSIVNIQIHTHQTMYLYFDYALHFSFLFCF